MQENIKIIEIIFLPRVTNFKLILIVTGYGRSNFFGFKFGFVKDWYSQSKSIMLGFEFSLLDIFQSCSH